MGGWRGLGVVGAVVLIASLVAGCNSGASPSPPKLGDARDLETSRAERKERRPNVLLVVTDDQRLGTLSAMPHTRRWLGDGGRTFVDAFANTPLCCPARASIMSGRFTHNHRVKSNASVRRLDQHKTLQRILDGHGYRTGVVGKYINGWPLWRRPPHFDRWATFGRGYYDARFNVEGDIRRVRRYSTRFMADKAVQFLNGFDRRDRKPWFLYVAPYAPHIPATPEPRHSSDRVVPFKVRPSMTESDRTDKPPYVRSSSTSDSWAEWHRNDQLRSLMSVDDMMLRFRRALSRLEEGRRTIVIFVSDNGYMWGEHELATKRFPYTESIRVPMMMRWPRRLEPGSRDRRFVAHVDLAPTVLDAAELRIPRWMDGRSVLGSHRRSHMFLEYFRDVGTTPQWASTVTRRWQYVEYYEDDRIVFRELYSLRRDPWQMTNLLRDGDPANDPPRSRLRYLHRRLAHDRRCDGTACP